MTREEVWKRVSDELRYGFGRLLEVRDVRRVRRVAGDAWTVSVVLTSPTGDLHVADLTVDDRGDILPPLDGSHVIEAVRRAVSASAAPPPSDEVLDFVGDLTADSDDDSQFGFDLLSDEGVEEQVGFALARGDTSALMSAREMLPRLLAHHERRGATLMTMAQVELKLEQPGTARGYVEAAAREFADRFDLDSLERAAALALGIDGAKTFAGSPVQQLLERSRSRLVPVTSIYDSRSFGWLSEALRPKLEANLGLRTYAPGDVIVTEGEPSLEVFVIKSGLVGVWLEKPAGGSWLVRSCFPGWLLGESSVLGGEHPRCMATLRAERVCEVWVVAGSVVRELMFEDMAFGQRIAETKQLHRIDSFFSMHETMGQLDVQVRDEILSCLQRLETFDEDTLLLPAHKVPSVACLVSRGAIDLFEDGRETPRATVEADSFYGLRDTIHGIESGFTAVARAGTTVAFFDGTRLQRLCERSPEHVIAVLERMG